MVDEINLVGNYKQKPLTYNDFRFGVENQDKSIFETAANNPNVTLLNEQLDEISSEQGIIKTGWNDFKELVGFGSSVEKCEDYINQYKNGEITFEEASEKIAEFDSKQDSSLNLFSNIATSVLAITAIGVATVATGGIAVGAAIAIGAAVGAATKAGMKTLDRATNEVKGDAGDMKEIAKDALSGAVTGGLATATMGTAGGASCVKEAVKNCAITGAKTGAISGAANYSIDCTFDEDKDFNFGELASATASNAATGAVVGAVMGGANRYMRDTGILKAGCNLEKMVEGNNDVAKEVAANSVCTSEYKILNDRLKSIAA